MFDKEKWKVIPSQESYLISDHGKVASLYGGDVKILKQRITKHGYNSVTLSGKDYRVHRLVACTFMNKPLNTKLCVCHKDDNPLNNSLDNLFLGTHKENTADMISKGRQNIQMKGEKLDAKKALDIRAMYSNGFIMKDIAAKYSVSITMVSQIIRRKKWSKI